MARDGSGVFSFVSDDAVSGGTCSSTEYNEMRTELVTLSNEARPVTRGGTGATTAGAARTNLAVGDKHGDGTVSLPAVSFSGDTNSGMYRIGADNIGFAANGAKVFEYNTAALLGPAGTVSLPGIGFHADPDSGMYRIGANNVGFAVNGTKQFEISTAGTAFATTATFNASNAIDIGDYDSGGTDVKRISKTVFASYRNTTSPATHQQFQNPNSTVGSISTSVVSTSFNTSSDERLKTDPKPFDAGPIIDALEPVSFMWKADGSADYGLFAQAAHRVWDKPVKVGSGPEMQPGDKDFEAWMIDYKAYVPLLLAEVKALRKRVAELEAK